MAIVGRPNVGKSSLLNALIGEKLAIVTSKPQTTRTRVTGVLTRDDCQFVFLDTPGILWPKFEDPEVGIRLAYTGAVKDQILDIEELASHLLKRMWTRYPDAVKARYKIEMPEDAQGWELLEAAARKRGFLLARGELNTERMAHVLMEEYRSGKRGRFTFEGPEIYEQEQEDGRSVDN